MESRKNLWSETIEVLKENGKTWRDVEFVCFDGEDYHCEIGNFETIARNTNYDNGYGSIKISGILKVVGKDWWLERGEYDGSEWWEYKTMPIRPAEKINVTEL